MTVTSVPLVQDDRAGRDRLEVLTAPSFEPLFRAEIIKIPLGHPVYRWECLVIGCERSRMGHGDLCSAHLEQWCHLQRSGEEPKAVSCAPPGPSGWPHGPVSGGAGSARNGQREPHPAARVRSIQ